jgi:hypothetical protein
MWLQKTAFFIATVVRTSNPTYKCICLCIGMELGGSPSKGITYIEEVLRRSAEENIQS